MGTATANGLSQAVDQLIEQARNLPRPTSDTQAYDGLSESYVRRLRELAEIVTAWQSQRCPTDKLTVEQCTKLLAEHAKAVRLSEFHLQWFPKSFADVQRAMRYTVDNPLGFVITALRKFATMDAGIVRAAIDLMMPDLQTEMRRYRSTGQILMGTRPIDPIGFFFVKLGIIAKRIKEKQAKQTDEEPHPKYPALQMQYPPTSGPVASPEFRRQMLAEIRAGLEGKKGQS